MCWRVGRWGPCHVLGLLGVLVGAIWVGVLTGYDQGVLWGHPGPQVHSLHPWQGQSQMHVTCRRSHLCMMLINQTKAVHPAKPVMIEIVLVERYIAVVLPGHILMHCTGIKHGQKLYVP